MPLTKQLVESLAQLPTELALEIINDLRLWDVIKLMLRDNPRINSYLLAHGRCRALLGHDAETLTKTREQIRDHLEFAAKRNLNLCMLHDAFYARSLSNSLDKPVADWQVIYSVHWRVFLKIPVSFDGLLRPYAKSPDALTKLTIFSSLEEYKQYWDTMADAKSVLDRKCSDQLSLAATLLEENPDILKRTTDPDQKRRPNTQHVVSRMRQVAGIIQRRKAQDFRRVEYFRYDFFPIIPFDRALEYLLYMIEKHRMSASDQIPAGSQHPPAMANLAQAVVDGMAYFYPPRPAKRLTFCPINNKGDVLRTMNTPWSIKPEDKVRWGHVDAVMFTPSMDTHLPAWYRVREFDAHEPHSAREEVWVKAFVELYRYLETLEKGQV